MAVALVTLTVLLAVNIPLKRSSDMNTELCPVTECAFERTRGKSRELHRDGVSVYSAIA